MGSFYTEHFGLHSEPFGLTPDPTFLYRSAGHSEALAALQIGLQGRRGLILMTGEVGTGKTTLLYSLLPDISADARVAYITNTKLSFEEILSQALADFGIPVRHRSRAALLGELKGFLLRCAEEGSVAALVIDEAQNLEDDCLENLRLLSNVETFTDKLLQIVLVGQPELMNKLAASHLRQLRERIAVYSEIKSLSWRDSYAYVAHRLQQAGGSIELFSKPALALLLWNACGIPRRINILCHNAMLFAYGRGAQRITLAPARSALRAGVLRSPLVSGERGLASLRRAFRTQRAGAPTSTPAPSKRAKTKKKAPLASAPQVARSMPGYVIGIILLAIALWWLAPLAATSARVPGERPAAAATEPAASRLVRVPLGVTLSDLARQEYGRVDAHLIAQIHPQHAIASTSHIVPGDVLVFPNPGSGDQPQE